MSDTLSKGWAEVTLEEAGTWRTGGTPSRRNPAYFGKGIPWVKSGDLPDGPILETEEEITELGLQNSSAKLMPVGTISIALYGATIGKLGIMTFPAATNQACANVIPDTRLVEPKFLLNYLRSERRNFVLQGQGGAQPNISQEIVRSHAFRLAPLAEQRRIVTKLEKLLGKVDACQQRLAKIPILLKRFRQSVLAAACSGRLTADWREANSQEGEMPDGWVRKKLFEICRPKQWKTISTKELTPGGFPVYGANGKIGFYSEYNHENPTILITCRGATCGRVNVSEPRSYVNGNAMALDNLDQTIVMLRFAAWLLEARGLKDTITGSAQPQITRTSLEIVELLIPPLDEQQEIVRRVEALFALADQTQARYAKAKGHVEKLPQSILAKAFRGELVPQDPNDQPASVLLERIKNARSDSSQEGKNRRSNRSIACAAS